MVKKISFMLVSLITIFLLNGCGSSGGTTTTTKEATFVDAVVSNAKYISDTNLIGFTDKKGILKYIEGKKVKLYAGDIFLGEALPRDRGSIDVDTQKVITPLELANSNDITDKNVIKIATFLMAIDKDHDASNGIEIDTSLIPNNLSNKNILDLDLNSSFPNMSFPTTAEVVQHLSSTFGIEIPPPTIILNGAEKVEVILGNSYIEEKAIAKDFKGNLLEVDINSSNLQIDKLGTYNILYSATDIYGQKSTITREVKVISPKVLTESLDILKESCELSNELVGNNITLRSSSLNTNSDSDYISCLIEIDDNSTLKYGWYWGTPYTSQESRVFLDAILNIKDNITYQDAFAAPINTINSLDLSLKYSEFNITNQYDIAIKLPLYESNNTSIEPIYTIFLHLDFQDIEFSNFVKSITIDGKEFDIYKNIEDNKTRVDIVAKNQILELNFSIKELFDNIDSSLDNILEFYLGSIEFGSTVTYGSGLVIVDEFKSAIEFNSRLIDNSKLEESFISWYLNLDDTIDLNLAVDSSGTNWKWRATASNLELYSKNYTLVQRVSSASSNYFYTMFNNPFDMSNRYSAIKFTGVLGRDYNYRLMLYDGTKWCMADNSFDSNSFVRDDISSFKEIVETQSLIDGIEKDASIPSSLTLDQECSDFNFANIKGFGLEYSLKDGKDSGYFKMDTIALYKYLPKFGVVEDTLMQNSISSLLFGLCMTPSYSISTNETFINNYKEWVNYLRWPGGLMIEDYDLEFSGSDTTYSVGAWTSYIKEQIPTMDFLIGVSSSKGAVDEEDVESYGYGLVNYLNVDYNQSWGDNEALDKPLPLRYVEIGNEPDYVEGMTIEGYGKALQDYEKGIHKADSSVSILAPTTTYGGLTWMLPAILKDYGDSIDIVSIHDYSDDPMEYQSYLAMTKNFINHFMSDNDRRDKEDIKIALTEYNSLTPLYRKGVFHEESWAKIIWHGQSFSYFLQEGLHMASIWHAYINGGHAIYERDGTPYPLHYALKFWRENIDFTQNPRVALTNSTDKDILITSIKMDNKLAVVVINASPYEDKNITLSFNNHQFSNQVTIKRLTHTILDEFYDEKDVADNVDVEKLRFYNPDATIWEVENDDNTTTTKIKFPKITVDTQTEEATIINEELKYTFPKYTITIIEANR